MQSEASSRVPPVEKAAAGMGGIVETMSSHAIRYLAGPVLNLGLGFSPILIGFGLALTRLAGAVVDPLIGHWSDNARTSFGRRRPFMLAGAPLAGIAFAAIWWFPSEGSGYLWRFVLGTTVFFTAASLFVVPWEALLVELSNDSHERTRIQAYRSIAATFGALCLPWLFAATQYAPLGGTVRGGRWVGCAVGTLLAVCGAISALGVRERLPRRETRKRGSLRSGLAAAAGNRPFFLIVLMMVLYGPGLMSTEGLALYVNIFYVFGGKIAAGTLWQAYQGTLMYAAKFVWIPVMTAVASRIGKRRTLWLCFGLSFLSDILKGFCYNPAHPAQQLFIPLIQAPGMGPAWVMMASMLADATDLSPTPEGQNHVGMLMAISQWTQKTALMIAFALSGLYLAWSGFDVAKGIVQPVGTLLRLRLLVCLMPAGCTAAAMVLLAFHPLAERPRKP